jgi:hypothetical protein
MINSIEKQPIVVKIVDRENQKVGLKIRNPQDIGREALEKLVEVQVFGDGERDIIINDPQEKYHLPLPNNYLFEIKNLPPEKRSKMLKKITDAMSDAKEFSILIKLIPLSERFSKN